MASIVKNELREARAAMAEAAGAWRKLCQTADAFIAETPEFRADPHLNGFCFEESLTTYMGYVAAKLCAADGPICGEEAEILNLLSGTDWTEVGYNAALTSSPGEKMYDDVFKLLKPMMQLLANEGLRRNVDYQPSHDPVVQGVEAIARAAFLADATVSENELQELSRFTSRLRDLSAEMRAELDQQLAALKGKSTATETIAPHDETVEGCLAELHRLIGLNGVKAEVESLVNLAKVMKLRKERGLPVPEVAFHVIFTGNPGTGKTTVARIVARLYHHLGLVSKGHLVEVDRSGLVASFVGQTASKVTEVVGRAQGGVLFIDEAYALASHSENDYGAEAIATLLKLMEDKRDDLW